MRGFHELNTLYSVSIIKCEAAYNFVITTLVDQRVLEAKVLFVFVQVVMVTNSFEHLVTDEVVAYCERERALGLRVDVINN